MSFVSYSYFLFLAGLLILYYLLPHRLRWAVLLGGSLAFCFYLDTYSAIWLIGVSLVSYGASLGIAHFHNQGRKALAKTILILSLVASFGSLFCMKYLQMTMRYLESTVIGQGGQWDIPILSLAMPIGISFYLFQATGYLVDVYRQKTPLIRHIGHYVLSVTFFAKLTQGPIAPVRELVPQFTQKIKLDPLNMRKGAVRILIGLVKKAVVADRLAVIADSVFSSQNELSALSALIGIVFYAFQLYADFAGYTDIAIGSAQLFGLVLPENFKQPYLARSIADFWRRWHLTLSNWLKEYIYIPLGGSRVKPIRWAINVLIVFLVSGIWHGSGLTFVIWGGLHGLYQIIGKLTSRPRTFIKTKLPGGLRWFTDCISIILTFVLVCAAWTFFRAPTVSDAINLLSRLFCGNWAFSLAQLGVKANEWWFSVSMIALMIASDIVSEHAAIVELIEKSVLPVRWVIYLLLLFLLILFGMYGSLSAQSFIYVSF